VVVRDLYAELECRVDSGDEFARLARDWLTQVKAELFPELDRHLPSDATLRAQTSEDLFGVIGPPNVTWASLHLQRKPSPFGGSDGLYSPRAWQRVLNGLDSHPFDIDLTMMPLDAEGRLVNSPDAVSIGIHRQYDHPEWVQFVAEASSPLVPWQGSAKVQAEWVEFLERWAVQLNACYGHVADDAHPIVGTALEQATIGTATPTTPRCREVLRGYSWVTICAPELVDRLGGVAALTRSGAFYEVRELPGGQVLLQATPLLEQYEGVAVERVFRVLAPVLLPGRVDEVNSPRLWRLVVGVDAADYQ
jgi:hypothetical protein